MRTTYDVMKNDGPLCEERQETQLSLTNSATSLEVRQGHQTIEDVRYGFLLVCYSNFVPMTRRFWDIRLRKVSWPWNPG